MWRRAFATVLNGAQTSSVALGACASVVRSDSLLQNLARVGRTITQTTCSDIVQPRVWCSSPNIRYKTLHRSLLRGQHVGGTLGQKRSVHSFVQRRPDLDPNTVVYGLMGMNLVVFGMWSTPSISSRFMQRHFTTSWSSIARGDWHTLLTHAVSHKSVLHLGANMLTFYFFAPQLAAAIGGMRFLQLYWAAAATGAGAQIYLNKYSPMLGASGAVNAIVIMTAMFSPYSIYIINFVPLRAWQAAALWLAFDLYGVSQGGGNIGYAAHLGGAAVGALGFVAFRRRIW